MMKTKQITALCLGSVLIGLLLGVGRIFMSVSALQAGIEMYSRESALPTVYHIILFAAAAAALILGLLLGARTKKKGGTLCPGKAGQALSFISLLMAFMLLAYDGMTVYSMARSRWSELGPLLGVQVEGVTFASAIFSLLFLIAAIPASVYFFKTSSADPEQISAGYGICAVMPVVWFILCALHTYFDTATAFNSPVKIVRILAILLFVLFSVHDARCVLRIADPRAFYGFAFPAIIVGTAQAVSDAVVYGMGGIRMSAGYLGTALELIYVFYIMFRVTAAGTEPKTEAPAAGSDSTAAAAEAAEEETPEEKQA